MRETLLSFLDDCARRASDMAQAHWRGLRLVRWSYRRLAATAYQFACELEARGIGKGDRVLIQAENSPEYVAAFFGCLLRGAVIVPLDRQSAPDFVARVQQQVAAKLMLTGEAITEPSEINLPRLSLTNLSELVASHPATPYPAKDINRDELIEIIFTSGTTAEPKGVCITHRNYLANLEPLEREIKKYLRWERLVHPIRFLCLPPLSHIFGQFMGILVPQLLGGEVYFQASLNPAEIIEAVRKQRISVIVSVPRVLETLRDKLERDYAGRNETERFRESFAAAEQQHFLRRWWTFRDVHRRFGWKFWAFVTGGATLNQETETFWRRLGYGVFQGYGMTETASLISLPHPFKSVHGAIGKTLPGQEMKLDEKGEILVRGENVSPGYWRGELKPLTDSRGWLRTGDIGAQDEEGNLFFRGRQKDMIATSAGLKIFPEDLEAALDRQGEVRASCVVGIEGPRGPEPFAALILRDPQADPEAIIRRANATLAEHQHIRRWMLWPESDFPRTGATQKIPRRLVAEAVQAHLAGQAPSPAQTGTLAELVARIGGQAAVITGSTANPATGLQLDSLGRVELLSALEDRYQIELDEAAFTAATTLTDIEQMIHAGAPEVAPYPYPQWTQAFPITRIRFLVLHALILPFTWLMGRARVSGREHLRDVRGPVLFIANHITIADPALVLLALPARWRSRIAIAMIGEFLREWRHPPAGTSWLKRVVWRVKYVLVVALFNVFSLPQQSGFRRSFAFAGETMDRGYSLLVFPEGQRTTHGRLNPFMAGTGLLVKKLAVPVIPIRIDGLFELKQLHRYFARPGQVSVTIGAPINFTHDQTPAQVTKELEAKLSAL
jgi:long-chain acyl-CoA synthetase